MDIFAGLHLVYCTIANTYYRIPPPVLDASDYLFQLDSGQAGQIKYTGALTQKFVITVYISAYASTTASTIFRVYKNGVYISPGQYHLGYQEINITFPVIVSLSTNDTLSLWTKNANASTTLTVSNFAIMAVGMKPC